MIDALRPRVNAIASVVVVVALVASVAALAARSDGFDETEVDLHEEGVWTTKDQRIARFNLQIDEFEVSIPRDPGDDVAQSGLDVVGYGSGALARIYPQTAKPTDPVKGPKVATLRFGGETAMVADEVNGRVWAMPRAQVGTAAVDDPKTALYAAEGKDRTIAATVDATGTVHVYREGEREVLSFGAGAWAQASPVPTRTSIGQTVGKPQIATVGTRVVLLDREVGVISVVDGPTRDLSRYGNPEDLQLQMDSEAADSVLVAGGGRLIELGLTDGSVEEVLAEGGGLGAIRPVQGRGCAWAAFESNAKWARTCDLLGQGGSEDLDLTVRNEAIDGIDPGASLVFRVNRGRVVLNEYVTGTVSTVDKPEPKTIAWDDPEKEGAGGDDDDDDDVDDIQDDCTQGAGVTANPDVAATRPGRPVIVAVLDNDEGADCQSAMTVELKLQPQGGHRAAVVNDHTAIQVTPADGAASGQIVVQYEARGADGVKSASSTLTVTIRPVEDNSPPESVEDATKVGVGRSLDHDVLRNDTDPDGDPLKLVEVTANGDAPPIRFRAEGIVTFDAPATAGTFTYSYVPADIYGDRGEPGKLTIEVIDKAEPPETNPDVVVVARGKTGRVNVLANDTDTDTPRAELSLQGVTGQSVGIQVDHESDGTVTVVNADRVQSYELTYTVSDGSSSSEGTLLVRVEDRADNAPPVAVIDTVFVRPDRPTVVDVLANDLDADGDVLAVPDTAPVDDPEVTVEVLDLRLLRITTPLGFEPFEVHYTVSDGTDADQGTLVVVPFEEGVKNYPPRATDDNAEVKLAQWTAVNVIANDVDPEEEQLTLEQDLQVIGGDQVGVAFVQGDQIRFRGTVAGPVEVEYTIHDPAGNPDVGRLRVQVSDQDDNRPPDVVELEARVFAGKSVTIPVPLVGMDPDGDVVSIVGVSPVAPPLRGDVKRVAKGLEYRADAGAGGTDQFKFTLADGKGGSSDSTVRVVIVEQPDAQLPPVAMPDEITIEAGAPGRYVDVLANDTDPEFGDLRLGATPDDAPRVLPDTAGTANLRRGRLWYEPPSSIDEPEQSVVVTYRVYDPAGLYDDGVVRVRLLRQGSDIQVPPVAVDDPEELDHLLLPGESIEIDLTANDVDPDDPDPKFQPAVDPATPGADWEVEPLGGGNFRFTVGRSSVVTRYTITDADGNKASALVTIPVVEEAPPEAVLDEGYTAKIGDPDGVTIPVLANDLPEGKVTLVGVIPESVRGGTVQKQGDRVRFVATGVPGEGGFSYVIANAGQQTVGRARVRVIAGDGDPDTEETPDTPTNTPPRFLQTPRQVIRAAAPALTLNLTNFVRDDEEATQSLTLSRTSPETDTATGLRARLSGTTLTLQAPGDAKGGQTRVALSVSDGVNPAVEGYIDVTVDADKAPQTPRANPDPDHKAKAGEPINIPVLDNDWKDPSFPELNLVLVGKPTQGTVGCDGRCITFTPTKDQAGQEVRIEYTVGDDYEREDGTKPPGRTSTGIATVKVYGRPGKPGKPNGEMRSRAVDLTWDRAPDNGLPILGYLVEISGGGQRDATANSLAVEDLTNGQEYKFRVGAFNEVFGKGDIAPESWSDWSDPIKPDKIPGAPTGVEIRFDPNDNAGGAGGVLHLSWGDTPNEGSPIEGFEIQSSNGGATIPAGPTERSIRIDGLSNGIDYTFKLRARNGLDWGEWSSPSNVEHPTAKPSAPTNVTARQDPPEFTDRSTVIVEFDHTDPTGRPEDDLEYTLAVAPNQGTVPNPFTSGGMVTGLTPGGTYTYTVTPSNRAGSGPAGVSAASRAFAKASPPTGVSARSVSEAQMRVDWTGSDDGGGSPAASYLVTQSPGGATRTTSGSSTSVDFPVSDGGTYTYTVTARSPKNDPAWDSAPSGASSPVTHFTAPRVSAAGARTESRTGASTAVVWSWPKQNGVDNYSAVVSEVGAVAPSCGSSTCEVVYGAGFGAPRTFQVVVTAHGPSPDYAPSSGSVTSSSTSDTRSVVVQQAGDASGEGTIQGGRCTGCTYGEARGSGFEPGTHLTITPLTHMDDNYNRSSNWLSFSGRYGHVTVDSGGNWYVGGPSKAVTYWYAGNFNDGSRGDSTVSVCPGHQGGPLLPCSIGVSIPVMIH